MEVSNHFGIVDLSSNIHRNFNKMKGNANTQYETQYLGDIPIYCVRVTLLQLIKEQNVVSYLRGKLTHCLIVLDHWGKNFRHELYPDYKGNRPPEDPELTVQKTIIYECLQLLGYPCICHEGVEADDVIGTLGKKCSRNRIKTTIFTRDKDTFAVIDKQNVKVYSGLDKKLYGWDDVLDSKGVPPNKITDYLTLVGDTADNVYGVRGIGPKTASILLSKYTLDDLIAEPTLIKHSGIRGCNTAYESFVASIDHVLLMRKVIALKTDLELNKVLADFRYLRMQTDLDGIIVQAVNALRSQGKI